LFLAFVARPIAVFAILTPGKCKINQQLFVSFAGLRGAASIVFAIMVTVNSATTKNDVFHIVFFIVLLSITFQGTLLPIMAKKLHMIDKDSNVLKTFNDYSEETEVQFIQLKVKEQHPWKGKELQEIVFPPDTLLVMIIRENQTIVPSGNTMLCENDIAILSALSYADEKRIHLSELKIKEGSLWVNKEIQEFSPSPDQIVILIKRRNKVIIPKGQTRIEQEDLLVMNKLL
ncbi:MAG: TrkA C-terminal domain-containing protein, partial [Lachnospiraceae bacterium]|nr:TrkA C-terminal domain-containing protein [Lachnospiraceae bacterium]